MIIEYSPEGEPVNNFHAERWVEEKLVKDEDVKISSSLPFAIIQRMIAEGSLPVGRVTFKYGVDYFTPNQYGAIMERPDGFCGEEVREAERILCAAMAKRRSERLMDEDHIDRIVNAVHRIK